MTQPPVQDAENTELASEALPKAVLAKVGGEALVEAPKDLYIPPDALEIFLEAFEGPLDLLLYLIRRQNLDILDIPVALITQQYMDYIAMMSDMRFELAAEYMLMAAMLAEIKSRMLLPRAKTEDDDDTDPRAELVRRLQEYERFKKAAMDVEALPRMNRELHKASAQAPELPREAPLPDVDLKELLMAFRDVLQRAEMFTSHQVEVETLSLRERMSRVLLALQADEFISFQSLFDEEEGRMGVVVSFLAIMELVKESLITIVQNEIYGALYVKAGSVAAPEAVGDEQEQLDV
ncbi:MAG: ScpA family protein [Gammaproteobacteria bacterium]|nr:ScpA family protein [Gammaproteobacteria bacterium]